MYPNASSPNVNPWRGAIAGALGGIAASVAMDLVSHLWTLAFRGKMTPREEALSHQGGRPDVEAAKTHGPGAEVPGAIATTIVAQQIAQPILKRDLSSSERIRGGVITHYSFGAITGAAYGASVEFAPSLAAYRGLAFGLAVWAGAVEITLPLIGLSKAPNRYTAREHAFSVASHATYGLVLEATRRRLRGIV